MLRNTPYDDSELLHTPRTEGMHYVTVRLPEDDAGEMPGRRAMNLVRAVRAELGDVMVSIRGEDAEVCVPPDIAPDEVRQVLIVKGYLSPAEADAASEDEEPLHLPVEFGEVAPAQRVAS